MRILIDTDVLLDFALGREPFALAAKGVIAWAEANPGSAAIAWHSISNLAYLAPFNARSFLKGLLQFVEVSPAGTADAVRALGFSMSDIEDALQASAALAFEADLIVTRNIRHYRHSPVPVLSPREFPRRLEMTEQSGRIRQLLEISGICGRFCFCGSRSSRNQGELMRSRVL